VPKYEKAMSRLAEEALKEDEQREKKKQKTEAPKEDEKEEKKTRVRGSVDDYTQEDWEQVAKKVRFNEKGVAFVPSSSSASGNEKRSATDVPAGERSSKSSHVEPARGSTRASPSDPVSPSKKLKMDELGSVTTADLDDCAPSGKIGFRVSYVLFRRMSVTTCLYLRKNYIPMGLDAYLSWKMSVRSIEAF